MSAEQAQKQTFENTLEPQLLTWGNDFEVGRPQDDPNYWHETKLYDNQDGTRTIFVAMHAYRSGEVPLPGSETTDTDYTSFTQHQSNFKNVKILSELMDCPIGTALKLVGYDVDEISAGGAIEARYPAAELLNNRFDLIRRATGFAPHVSVFDGRYFTEVGTQEKAIGQGELIFADDPEGETHDMIGHAPAWIFLSESLMAKLAARTSALYSDYLEHKHGDSAGVLSRHMAEIDTVMDIGLVEDISETLKGNDHLQSIASTVRGLLYGRSPNILTKRQETEIHEEAVRLLDRARQLISLGEAEQLAA